MSQLRTAFEDSRLNLALFLTFTFFLAASLVGFVANEVDEPADAAEEPAPVEEAPEEDVTAEACPSWEAEEADHGQNRWFAEGLESIREAETDDEARAAAEDWLDRVKVHPNLLVGASQFFLEKDVDTSTLFDEESCATDEAEQLVAELETALAMSEISVEDAPAHGYNSGVDADGVAGIAAHQGITGDRKAIKIVMPDGKKVWIMARCANPVVEKPPKVPVPEVPVDEPAPEPKCFDEHGNPVFDGEFCGDPDSGPDFQDPQDNDPEHTKPTDGYPERGHAEKVRDIQEEDKKAIEDGKQDPYEPTDKGVEVDDSKEGGKAPAGETDHKDKDGNESEKGTDKGTSDPEETEASQPEDEENEEEVDNPW